MLRGNVRFAAPEQALADHLQTFGIGFRSVTFLDRASA
jgi:hypothetical protein